MKNHYLFPISQPFLYGIILFILFFTCSCVSKSQYSTLEQKYNDLDQHNASLQKENDKFKKDKDWFQSKSISLSKQVNELQEENDQLTAKKQELLVQKEIQQQKLQRVMEELNNEISDNEAKTTLLENTVKVELIDKVFFKEGSATVTPEGRKILSRIAPILKNAQNQEIRVIGHTDELPPSSKLSEEYPSNWELSTARATAVIRILQWGYGLDPEKLVAQGVAHYRMKDIVFEGKKTTRKYKRAVEILLTPYRPDDI